MPEEIIEENKDEASEEESSVETSGATAAAVATTQSETVEMESSEDEDGGFNLFDIVIFFVVALAEVIDYATGLLNLTGAWLIVAFIINLVFLLFIALLKVARDGLSLKAIFGTWKQVLCLVIEFFPVVGDIVPGFLLYFLFGINKGKKAKPKISIEPAKAEIAKTEPTKIEPKKESIPREPTPKRPMPASEGRPQEKEETKEQRPPFEERQTRGGVPPAGSGTEKEPKNDHDVLGVPRGASQEEIKSAYRKMMREHHPDLHPNDPQATKMSQEINAAYERLKEKD